MAEDPHICEDAKGFVLQMQQRSIGKETEGAQVMALDRWNSWCSETFLKRP